MADFFPVGKWKRTLEGGKTALKLGGRTVQYLSRKPFIGSDRRQSSKEAFDRQSGEILFQGLSALKGTALKIAQMLSLEMDIFPPAVRQELSKSCYQVPPMNRALVRKILTSNLGRPPEALFCSFEPTAFAAASLGQVHRAVAKNGRTLAVKIQYPGIDTTIRNDIQMIKALVYPLPEYALLRPVLKEIEERLLEETDYELEARHIGFFKKNLKINKVRIPDLLAETSCRHVLSESRLEGVPLTEWLSHDPPRAERDEVAQRLHDIFLHGFYEMHAIHADPNPGNFLIAADLTVGLVDFGCVKRFDSRFTDLYRQLPRMALKGSTQQIWDLIRSFELIAPHTSDEAAAMISGHFLEIGRWFGRIYAEEYFDFGAHPEFIEEGKQIGFKSMALRKYMQDVNTNFIYLHRTRYGLIRLFEMMGARVRMWNPYEWEGAEDGEK